MIQKKLKKILKKERNQNSLILKTYTYKTISYKHCKYLSLRLTDCRLNTLKTWWFIFQNENPFYIPQYLPSEQNHILEHKILPFFKLWPNLMAPPNKDNPQSKRLTSMIVQIQ